MRGANTRFCRNANLPLAKPQRRQRMKTVGAGVLLAWLVGCGPQITETEAGDLQLLREEEKLARDLFRDWSDRSELFGAVAHSKQLHFEIVGALLQRHQVTDRTLGGEGLYVFPQLQTLHQELLARGGSTELEALAAGAELHERDLVGLEEAAGRSQLEDVRASLAEIQRGARNHLRGCVEELALQGVDYAPRLLSPEAFAAIINSPRE